MKFTSLIDNYHTGKWGISLQEAYVFSWMYDVPSWAKTIIIDNEIWYFASKTKAIADTNKVLTEKPDTMYRYYKKLEEKGLIENKKLGKEDYIRITEKGKQWNSLGKKSEYSENNPTELGKKSEFNSENNPTYYSISNTDYSISNKEIHVEEEKKSKKDLGDEVAEEAVELLRRLLGITKGKKSKGKEVRARYNELVMGNGKVSHKEAREIILATICVHTLKWYGVTWSDGKDATEYLRFSTLFGKNTFFDRYYNPTVLQLKKYSLDQIKQQAFLHVGLSSDSSQENAELGLQSLLVGLCKQNYQKRADVALERQKKAQNKEEWNEANQVLSSIKTQAHQNGWFS